jgi:hypothetical protein
MNEVMLEAAGYFDESPDCQHDWQIEFFDQRVIDGYWQARCKDCNKIDLPNVMNGYVRLLVSENDALGKVLSEHVDILAARDKRIKELEIELARAKGYEEGYKLQVGIAQLRLKALEDELADTPLKKAAPELLRACELARYWINRTAERYPAQLEGETSVLDVLDSVIERVRSEYYVNKESARR